MEIIAFTLSLICVALNAYGHIFTWPLMIASSAAYAWVFQDAKLFGDAWLQGVFILLAIYAWKTWSKSTQPEGTNNSSSSSFKKMPRSWPLIGSLCWSGLFLIIHYLLVNHTSSDVPLIDAFLTAGSLLATYMSAQKWLENWLVWIFVNSLYIALYIYKDLHLTALLYGLLIVLAVLGWLQWSKKIKQSEPTA
ncbi:nicotinamide riboside transporter PnuC [Polynucleobacter sp. AM-26B4]|uniref:nicotinamide riboside transporter PnuC n=1 Tax=Polynucleobacter sp. AM-26B4 TaxID=2689103 RepID=UPI001C0B619F|nr:nicotinamide riboside transporter PnuC [Polynucleobacter sp. AM-26B4]MBU3586145.1 nicotinamide mononucleotide transporter [Polynucleobacter sp. AM-26B4]